MRTKPREFTAEFKTRAINLVLRENLTKAQVAKDLDIGMQNLSRWIVIHEKSQLEQRPSFTGRGVAALTEQEQRIKELEREVYVLTQEREILKAAAKFFAKEAK
jgi:transposase